MGSRWETVWNFQRQEQLDGAGAWPRAARSSDVWATDFIGAADRALWMKQYSTPELSVGARANVKSGGMNVDQRCMASTREQETDQAGCGACCSRSHGVLWREPADTVELAFVAMWAGA